MNGWIILDKPSGMSSAQAVARVKRLLHPVGREAAAQDIALSRRDPAQRLRRSQDLKIGHAGTLDPLASGVLPLALGEATKTVSYMMDAGKAYSFTVQWGQQRDTDDREGQITAESPNRPEKEEIISVLPKFIGNIQQTPPVYSAIKVAGERAYAMARAGEAPVLEPRQVTVTSLEITDFTPETATFTCHCGKGTYIRSLARDMGRELGCYGHISALRRLKVGKFDESQAISLEILEKMVHKGDLGFLLPVESALDDIPALEVTTSQAALLKAGRALPKAPDVSSETVLARCEGRAIAICRVEDGQMKPVRVFNL